MNFKEFYTEQTWYDKVKRLPRKAINFVKDVEQGADKTSGLYKLGKDIGGGAIKLADPFSNKGLVGRAANLASNVENWMRAGSNLTTGAGSIFSNKGNQLDQISAFRDKYVYPRDNDVQLNKSVGQILKLPTGFPINLKQQKSLGFGHSITKRGRSIDYASHLANIVIDEYVRNLKNGVPANKAMTQATKDLNNPQLVKFFRDQKLLPF